MIKYDEETETLTIVGGESGQEIWEEILAIMEHHNVSAEWISEEGSDEYGKRSMKLSKIFRLQRS